MFIDETGASTKMARHHGRTLPAVTRCDTCRRAGCRQTGAAQVTPDLDINHYAQALVDHHREDAAIVAASRRDLERLAKTA